MQASARLSSSPGTFREVVAGVSSATTRSCYRTSRRKAHAAPLPAQEPTPKGQKRITKQERRARIVEFVDNYRASNDGKFPTVKSICQQLGGSHYTVREVLQEMEYNHAKLRLGNVKDLTDKPDPGNQKREIEANKFDLKNQKKEIEANKFDLKNSKKSLNANDSNASDQRAGDIVNEAKTHSRDDNPKHEESANMGFLGSLRSFAYGIRNFWKNM